MLLQDLLTISRFKLNLESETKEEVFEELTDVLVASQKELSRDGILRALHERERKMSTGMAPGIAIPHGSIQGLQTPLVAAGISEDGIEYEALDGKPVHLVVMILSPAEQPEAHLRLLKRVAALIQNPLFVKEILSVQRPEQAHALVKSYENLLGFKE